MSTTKKSTVSMVKTHANMTSSKTIKKKKIFKKILFLKFKNRGHGLDM